MKFFSILAFLIAPVSLFAQNGGIKSFAFLNLPVSARQASLGGNVLAIKDDDLNLAYLNPALLSDTLHNQLTLNYINYFSDINFGYAGYARHFDKIGTFSAGMHFLNYGKFKRADEVGELLGEFSAGEYALNIGYGRPILDSSLSVGANWKFIYSNLDIANSLATSLDLSATYYNKKALFGATFLIRNAGIQITKYNKDQPREKLPIEMQIGISKKLQKAPIRFSLVYENLERFKLNYDTVVTKKAQQLGESDDNKKKKDNRPRFGDQFMRHIVLGVEITPGKNFALRAGFNYQQRKELLISTKPGTIGFSWGFGFKVYKFRVSYARATYHAAGASNHFTITTNLNAFGLN